ncbi:MAG: hypothetical protein HY860_06860 [Chlamydiales bacterium]|nr:hypothetical protein [Chlamydiales bacterium]
MASIIDSPDFDIRYTLPTDEIDLKRLLACPENNKWISIDVETGVDLFARNWLFYSKYQCALTAAYKNTICGMGIIFLMPYKKVSHLAMLYFVVDPSFKDVTSSLIKNLKHLAKEYLHLESMHLETFDGYPDTALLNSFGFKEIIRQEGYAIFDSELVDRIVLEVQL